MAHIAHAQILYCIRITRTRGPHIPGPGPVPQKARLLPVGGVSTKCLEPHYIALALAMAAGLRCFKLALVQLAVGADKAANLTRAGRLVREAAKKGAKVVALPVG